MDKQTEKITEIEYQKKCLEIATNSGIPITITNDNPTRFDKLKERLTFLGFKSNIRRNFILKHQTFAVFEKITQLKLNLDYDRIKEIKPDSITISDSKLILESSDTILKILVCALKNKANYKDKNLYNFLENNLTCKELFNLFVKITQMSDTAFFLISLQLSLNLSLK